MIELNYLVNRREELGEAADEPITHADQLSSLVHESPTKEVELVDAGAP